MKVVIAALVFSLASVVSAYPITGDVVNCRTGPGTSYAVKKSYNKNQDISISCQTTGTSVNGNNIWDKTGDDCYVADYYVKTGSSGFVTKQCSASSGGGGGSSSGGYCKTINAAGVDLIAKWEGFVASPKPDPIGLPTVGYGHLCQQKNCREVKYRFPLTKTTAKELLLDDLPKYTKCLAEYLDDKVKLNDNQWAVLTSWVFNVGCGNAKTSTLVKRLNKGDAADTVAAEELPKWRMAGGKVLPGLEARRKDEVKLFKAASAKQAHPKCQ
ncbi:glycoside hydrolase family 24 [Trichoderma cornu-damae]|uniref:Glycoside hydrolase family 24 n=1 Tax=Trichoderma cornu-damae TaxID=654480 RepID=A0A9P8QK36_9HYPO|nr:glycoside hydrolase family 24 [Trichoderma cornu-damae]